MTVIQLELFAMSTTPIEPEEGQDNEEEIEPDLDEPEGA